MRFKRFILLFPLLFICLLSFNFATAASNNPTDGPLTFQARVEYQRAIEEVYWRHRIWPKENPGVKPSLEKILPDSAIIAKVEDYLRKSNALELYWSRPITAKQLQAEMDRMVRNTKQPKLLGELFAALNNDPQIIAECLARPAIVDRFIRNWYANDDRFHGELRQRVESELRGASTQSMRGLSGRYSEAERVKENEKNAFRNQATISLNAQEWKEWTDQLQTVFGKQIQTQKLSSVLEDSDLIYVMAVLEKGNDKIKLAMVEWPKITFYSWWSDEKKRIPIDISEEFVTYTLKPLVASSSCVDDTWTPIQTPLPEARTGHTAVWTGTEMIVWGGWGNYGVVFSGGRYDPSTDTWTATNIFNTPEARRNHTAVWTGTEMIVWGGWGGWGGPSYHDYVSTGARYDPATDLWVQTSNINVPIGRTDHTAVWTGTEMIIWGGNSYGVLSSGGRYDPSIDTWTKTSNTNTPDARLGHTGVWTGSEMIVWGGWTNTAVLSTGARYNPLMDSWTATSNTNIPEGRYEHTAIWTGTEMIVWGGWGFVEAVWGGGRYNPSSDSWTATSSTNMPEVRFEHTAVWTGTEMIVWGGWGIDSEGIGDFLSSGGRYYPSTDSWAPIHNVNVPENRMYHTAVWTGTEMIIWGGNGGGAIEDHVYLSSGGRYNPSFDSWTPTSAVDVVRFGHTAVWTGMEMLVWGGHGISDPLSTGGRYDPTMDTWTATSNTTAPDSRSNHTAVWTGSEMIVWGGSGSWSIGLSSGGRYDPSTDSWLAINNTNAPDGRNIHTAVWSGTEMIVWGGQNSTGILGNGGRYDPFTNTWTAISNANVPDPRVGHTAVWSGTEMILWGGFNCVNGCFNFLSSGGRYDPSSDTWMATSSTNAPDPRARHTAVWTSTEMIVWGGYNYENGNTNILSSGSRYDPSTGTWTLTSNGNVPEPRYGHTAVWTGTEMIIWGPIYTGGRYNPLTDIWSRTSNDLNVPDSRTNYTVVWTGTHMIVWGGMGLFPFERMMETGGLYCVGPSLQISNASIDEGKKGTKALKFVVTLSTPLDFTVKVDYATADGTATEIGNDFVAKTGTKRIRRGQTTTTIKIKIKGDRIVESDEYFKVNLSNAIGAKILDPEGIGRIMNDD